MKMSGSKRSEFKHAPAVVLCLLALCSAAQAEGNPYSLGASVSLGSDDNLFRTAPGTEIRDRYATLSVFGGVDQSIGRQRLQANATLRRSQFKERRELDNTGYNVKLGWNGATEGDVSWDLSYETNRRLGSYGNIVASGLQVANIETTDLALAKLQLGLLALWVADVTLSHRDIDDSAAAYAGDRLRVDAIGLGLTWNPLGPVSASIGPRYTRGHYPQARTNADGSAEADDFVRQDIDFGLRWVASGASTLSARLSLTRQRADRFRERDVDGATGQLGWRWDVTGKTRFNASLSRDTGSESSFFTQTVLGESLRGSGDTSRLTNSASARIDYEATGKISLSLSGQYAQRRLSATSQLADGTVISESGTDRRASASLGARYAPTRNSVLGCGVGYERRGTRTTLSSAYRVNTVSCSAELSLR